MLSDNRIEAVIQVYTTLRGPAGYRINPITGASFLVPDDDIDTQIHAAQQILDAKDWFDAHCVVDAPPFPLSRHDRDELKYSSPIGHLVSMLWDSLNANDWDVSRHPKFEDFAGGVLASPNAPLILRDAGLEALFPPKPMPELDRHFIWRG